MESKALVFLFPLLLSGALSIVLAFRRRKKGKGGSGLDFPIMVLTLILVGYMALVNTLPVQTAVMLVAMAVVLEFIITLLCRKINTKK